VAKWPLVLAGGVAGLAGRRRGGGSVDGVVVASACCPRGSRSPSTDQVWSVV